MRFEHPEWLWLALAALPMAWLALRWFLTMSRARRWSAAVARVLLLLAIAALLAGALTVRTTQTLAVVAVIDVSDSVRQFADDPTGEHGQVLAAVRDYLAGASADRGPDDLLGVVAFDGQALAVAAPTRADPLTQPIDVRMREGTDIEAALRYASAMIPADAAGRIVLISDGNETEGRAAETAAELIARFTRAGGGSSGLPIDVVPIRYEVTAEVIVESVDVPPTAEAESVVPVRVVLRAAGEAEGTLRLFRAGEELDISRGDEGVGRRLRLTAGRRVEVAEVSLGAGRVHRFDAVWEPRVVGAGDGSSRLVGDRRTENNSASGLTITPGRGEVLIVDGLGRGSDGGAALGRTLEAAGFAVTAIAPTAMPEDIIALQAYDLVVLQDVPADMVTSAAQRALIAHVEELGAGLVMLGGANSFAPGGWRGSEVEPLLPVDLEIPDELIVPTAAVMIVLDASGSMGRSVMGTIASKQEIANESAALAVQTLDDRDLIGVISFDNLTREVVPLGPNDDPARTAERIRGIGPGGGTRIGPALRMAQDSLVAVDAEIKQVILLSDGQSSDAEVLPTIADELGQAGIKVTTISVGTTADAPTMQLVADRSGGAHYEVLNPNVLPRVFIRAIRIQRTPMLREIPFVPRIVPTGSTLVEGLGEAPTLGGLVLTRPRLEPTISTPMVTADGEPVLAHWQVGLGQVAAFTSDARADRWASAWAGRSSYADFWTNLARSMARPTTAGPYELRLDREGAGLALRLIAADEAGEPIDYLSVPASVYTEGGDAVEVRLSQVAPGLYETVLRDVGPGQLVAVVRPRLGEEALPPVVGGTTIASGAEFRSLRSNEGLLSELAVVSGGRELSLRDPLGARLFDRAGVPPRVTTTPVFLPLVALALGLFLLDVGTRRVAWDRFVSKEFGVDLRKAAAEATRDRGEQAGRALTGLRSREQAEAGDPPARSAPLDDAAAQRLVADARERREREELERFRKIREEMFGQAGEKPSGGSTEQSKPRDAQSGDSAADEGTSGLLAAKRRARERFERENDE